MTKNDYKFFAKAKQVATISDYYKIHIGCIAVYQGNIIGIGCNCNKTHPTQKFYNRYRTPSDSMLPKLHAEINCLNSIKHFAINFSKVKLYIYTGSGRISRLDYLAHVLPAWQQLRILGLEISTIQLMMDMLMRE
jgi:deoxycytidylate deaminase